MAKTGDRLNLSRSLSRIFPWMMRAALPRDKPVVKRDAGCLTIWVITDGTAGHENQSLGLTDAIARVIPTRVHKVPALSLIRTLGTLLFGPPQATSLPHPRLLIATGHRTHWMLLACARQTKAPTLVLMSPTLPRRCFDLCIVPEHDGIKPSSRTLLTKGALNRVQPGTMTRPEIGLILIGGPSSHFNWDAGALRHQIDLVVTRSSGIHWTLTDSRRTPAGFLQSLDRYTNLELISHDETPRTWLPERMKDAGTIWVSPDSVSMIFEALTAGARVGLFELEPRSRDRVARAVRQLEIQHDVTSFKTWVVTGKLEKRNEPLAEADRCAKWVVNWLEGQS